MFGGLGAFVIRYCYKVFSPISPILPESVIRTLFFSTFFFMFFSVFFHRAPERHFPAHVRARPSSFQYPEGELDLLIQVLVPFRPF